MHTLQLKHGIGFFDFMQQSPDTVTVRPQLHVSGNLNCKCEAKLAPLIARSETFGLLCLLSTLLMAAGVTCMIAPIVVNTDASNSTG